MPNVTSIGEKTFYQCSSLVTVSAPKLESIGNSAFYGCASLKTVATPELKSIESYAFYGCDSLLEINMEKVESIGNYAFSGQNFNNKLQAPDFSILKMPNVTSIGTDAFYNCDNLISILFSDKVTLIDSYAFSSCSNLQNIFFEGTAEDWVKIDIKGGNSTLQFALRYYYSEQEPPQNDAGTAYLGNYWHYVEGEPTIWIKQTQEEEV